MPCNLQRNRPGKGERTKGIRVSLSSLPMKGRTNQDGMMGHVEPGMGSSRLMGKEHETIELFSIE